MKKIVEIETRIVEKASPYIDSNLTLTYGEMLPLFNEVSPYLKQYSEIGNNVEPLIKSFVNAHVAAINNETARLNVILSEKTQQYNVLQDAQTRLNAINQAKINQYNSIRAVGASEGVTEAVVNGQLNVAGLIRQINCSYSSVGGMTPGGGSVTCY